MERKCVVSSCSKEASKCCGSCGLVRYCSVECQIEDWKRRHKKLECVNVKKLSSVSLTEEEIYTVAHKTVSISQRLLANGEDERSIGLLKECLVFAQDRLGRLNCKDSRGMIGDGVKLNHLTICRLLVNLGEVYYGMASSSESDSYCISYLSEASELLVQRKNAGEDEMVMWNLLFACEKPLYHLYAKIGQMEKAKYHAVQFVANARQYKGPDQANHLIAALSALSYIF